MADCRLKIADGTWQIENCKLPILGLMRVVSG
jgi:hypothetical protein